MAPAVPAPLLAAALHRLRPGSNDERNLNHEPPRRRTAARALAAAAAPEHLTHANLTHANLREANLAGADLAGATWPAGTRVPEGWELDAESGRLRRAGT